MNKTFYGHTLKINGLLNLDRVDTHIHNIDAKRCKVGNDSVKHMKKLHADGILESLDTCEPCVMGKMTKTPFSGTMERANDLLEIIHTDVCGPMSLKQAVGIIIF